MTPIDINSAVADLPPIVGAREAAERLGITVRTLRRWSAAGRISTLRTTPSGSGRVRILRTELARVLGEMQA